MHWWLVVSPHKGSVMQKLFLCHDIIILLSLYVVNMSNWDLPHSRGLLVYQFLLPLVNHCMSLTENWESTWCQLWQSWHHVQSNFFSTVMSLSSATVYGAFKPSGLEIYVVYHVKNVPNINSRDLFSFHQRPHILLIKNIFDLVFLGMTWKNNLYSIFKRKFLLNPPLVSPND